MRILWSHLNEDVLTLKMLNPDLGSYLNGWSDFWSWHWIISLTKRDPIFVDYLNMLSLGTLEIDTTFVERRARLENWLLQIYMHARINKGVSPLVLSGNIPHLSHKTLCFPSSLLCHLVISPSIPFQKLLWNPKARPDLLKTSTPIGW